MFGRIAGSLAAGALFISLIRLARGLYLMRKRDRIQGRNAQLLEEALHDEFSRLPVIGISYPAPVHLAAGSEPGTIGLSETKVDGVVW